MTVTNPKPNDTITPDLRDQSVAAPPPAYLLVALMLLAAAVALTIAIKAPLATTVVGLIIFGVLHNVLEIRYVAGRFASLLTGRFLGLLLVLITGILCCRLIAGYLPLVARYAEISLGYVILGIGAWIGLSRRWFPIAAAILALTAWASFSWPGYHFVMLTHLHNLVPLIFLWDWASRIPSPRARLAFRLTQVLWILIMPIVILTGALDALLSADPGVVAKFVGDGSQVIAASAPPATPDVIGIRLLVIFAFMQTMHYVVWVGFLPKFAPDAAAAFEQRVPWLRGRRVWLVGLVGGGFLAILFFSDYFQGKALYGALATYHAYLEFPVLLALLMQGGGFGVRREQR